MGSPRPASPLILLPPTQTTAGSASRPSSSPQASSAALTHLSPRDLAIVIGLFFSVFAIGADSFIISPLLPAMAHDFSVSIGAVSLAVTLYAICYAVGSPLFGAAWGPL